MTEASFNRVCRRCGKDFSKASELLGEDAFKMHVQVHAIEDVERALQLIDEYESFIQRVLSSLSGPVRLMGLELQKRCHNLKVRATQICFSEASVFKIH